MVSIHFAICLKSCNVSVKQGKATRFPDKLKSFKFQPNVTCYGAYNVGKKKKRVSIILFALKDPEFIQTHFIAIIMIY